MCSLCFISFNPHQPLGAEFCCLPTLEMKQLRNTEEVSSLPESQASSLRRCRSRLYGVKHCPQVQTSHKSKDRDASQPHSLPHGHHCPVTGGHREADLPLPLEEWELCSVNCEMRSSCRRVHFGKGRGKGKKKTPEVSQTATTTYSCFSESRTPLP